MVYTDSLDNWTKKATIAGWHRRIRRRLFPQMTDPGWLYLRIRGGDRSVLVEQWIEMICRSCNAR